MVEEEQTICNTAPIAYNFWQNIVTKSSWYDAEKEQVIVLTLNRKNRIIAFNLVSLGSAIDCTIRPREIFRPIIVAGGTALVVMHNHPSGDPAPSQADISITRRLRECATILDLTFIDHIIAGLVKYDLLGKGYYSMKEAGLI